MTRHERTFRIDRDRRLVLRLGTTSKFGGHLEWGAGVFVEDRHMGWTDRDPRPDRARELSVTFWRWTASLSYYWKGTRVQ